MPTIGTQTGWSWLEDLAERERFAKRHGAAIKDFQLQGTDVTGSGGSKESGDPVTCCNGATTSNSSPAAAAQARRSSNNKREAINLPPIAPIQENRDDGSVSLGANHTRACSTLHGSVPLPPVETHTGEGVKTVGFPSSPSHQENDGNTTQPLIPVDTPVDSNPPHNVTPLSVFHQLEQADYSEEEEEVSDETEPDSASSQEEEEGGTDDEIEDEPPKIPALQSVSDLPWPAVLHYVRESESKANQYFSLGNKDEVERRNKEAKAMLGQDSATRQDTATGQALMGEREGVAPAEEAGELASHKEDGSMFCHFCGKRLPRRSLLAETQDIDSMKEKDYICCSEYKEYTVLVAVCMRQMVAKMRTAPPEKIIFKARKKQDEKKLLEDKALTILRRKQKWEEIRKRREQEQEARRAKKKGTRTIQFTLDSPGEQEPWVVKQKHAKPANLRKRRASRKKIGEEGKVEVFATDTLERLKALAPPPGLGVLDRRLFDSGRVYLTLLPDRTGYCNYPSGNKAVVVFSLYEGALAYLVYEDSPHPQLLAYVDELGRSCCYYLSGNMRFLSIPHLMVQFDAGGHTRRKLKVSDASSCILFQPISVPLNKQVTVKCSQESTSISLSFPHEHFKFTVCSKLQKGDVPLYSDQLLLTTQDAEATLSRAKNRISQLLHLLQNISQIQKLSKLEALYGGGTSLRDKGPRNTKNDGAPSERRTRSVGAIKLKKSNTEKCIGSLKLV